MQDQVVLKYFEPVQILKDTKCSFVTVLSSPRDLSVAPWNIIIVGPAQLLVKLCKKEGSVGFLRNDVKLFCMLLFADVCSAEGKRSHRGIYWPHEICV